MNAHQHESWQLRPSGKRGVYCAACGEHVDAQLTYGVRDIGDQASPVVAAHQDRFSAERAVNAHPGWYELVCTVYPSDPKQRWYKV